MKTINVIIRFKSKSEAFWEIFTWMSLSLGTKQNLPINGWSHSIGIPLHPAVRKACFLLSFFFTFSSQQLLSGLGAFIKVSKRAEMFKLYAWNYQRTSSVQFSTVFPAAGMEQWLYSEVPFSIKSGLEQKLSQCW